MGVRFLVRVASARCVPLVAIVSVAVLRLGFPAVAAEPFEKPGRDYAVDASVTTSDGKAVSGLLHSTLGKPLKVYDREGRAYVEFALADVDRIDVAVEEARDEPVWRWKESGSDEKVYTGATYPWRKYVTTVTFSSGRKVTGDLDALLHLEAPDGARTRFLLHKRDKGAEGRKLSDLVYVRSIAIQR